MAKKWMRRAVVSLAVGVTGSVALSGVAPGVAAAGGGGSVDTGALLAIAQITGATDMWREGFYGQGVGVAVIDTGVARVAGLDAPGKVVDGPDLSFDSQDPSLAHVDAFGHGTHIAGIIAGTDVAPGTSGKGCKTCIDHTAYSDVTKFVGIAPEARIVNVKVGAYDGSVDVTQIVAGINWVIQHKDDPGLNIKVLNLSFGTDSTNPSEHDPLAYAVEQAWAAGITVVAAAGNDGEKPGPLADPAYSPSVIAVGTTDPRGTLPTKDDVVPTWAQHGTEERPVDVTAPGVSVASLRVPGSFVDSNTTSGRVGDRFQRASGTSQSTAVVSGLAALILSEFPDASPDAVKALLRSNTHKLLDQLLDPKGTGSIYGGTGVVNLEELVKSDMRKILRWLPTLGYPTPRSDGAGTVEAARGSFHVVLDGVPLTGELDIFGRPWDSASIAAQTAARRAWTGGTFNGSLWTSAAWSAGSWDPIAWPGTSWTGAPWDGARWSDQTWTDARWSGARWSGARWSGARWSDAGWDGARWSGARWSGARWSDAGWR